MRKCHKDGPSSFEHRYYKSKCIFEKRTYDAALDEGNLSPILSSILGLFVFCSGFSHVTRLQ